MRSEIWLSTAGELVVVGVDEHAWSSRSERVREVDFVVQRRLALDDDLGLPDLRWRAPRDFAFDPGGEGLYFERRAWIAKGGPRIHLGSTLSAALDALEQRQNG